MHSERQEKHDEIAIYQSVIARHIANIFKDGAAGRGASGKSAGVGTGLE